MINKIKDFIKKDRLPMLFIIMAVIIAIVVGISSGATYLQQEAEDFNPELVVPCAVTIQEEE